VAPAEPSTPVPSRRRWRPGTIVTVVAVVAGALLLSIFPEILRNVVVPIQQTLFGDVLVDPDAIRMLLFGIALVAVMIFRPEGLWPSQVRKRELNRGKEQKA